MAPAGIPRNQLQRVSPGVYRGAQGGLQTPTRGIPRQKLPNQGAKIGASAGAPNGVTPTSGGVQAPAPVDAANTAAPAADLTALNAQRQQTLNEIHRRGGIAKTPGFANQLNTLNTQIRGLRKAPPAAGTPTTGGPLIGNDQPPAPVAEEPKMGIPTGEVPTDVTNALYPSMNYQLPENYEGSPMYKWQMQKGNQALNRKLAQRGLLDSGAEIQSTNELSQAVGAQESDRLRQDFQTEADRYERVSANEASRRDNNENNNWSRRMDVINAMLRQSPMQQAYDGTNKYSDISMNRGKNKSNNTANNYQRVSAGGGRSMPGFVPPAAGGPDYSQADLMAAIMGNSNSRQNGSFLDSLFGSFFG